MAVSYEFYSLPESRNPCGSVRAVSVQALTTRTVRSVHGKTETALNVIPAKAGIQAARPYSGNHQGSLDSRFRALLSGINFHAQSFCAERSAVAAIHAAVDEDAPYGFRDFARNDTVESAQRSKPCFSSLHNAFLLLLVIYSGQQCVFAGMTKSWGCVLD